MRRVGGNENRSGSSDLLDAGAADLAEEDLGEVQSGMRPVPTSRARAALG
jgi:hypothetical protein